MAQGDQASHELCLIDRAITSLLAVPLSPKIRTLNVHCNQISRIEGLGHLWQLQHLDLSSNQVTRIEGLETLVALRTLNLSCNLITKVEGLNGLINLTRLNLSYNRITDLSGFSHLHGIGHKLSLVDLHSNCISNLKHLLQCMVGLCFLTDLTLTKDGRDNPVCQTAGYREVILQSLNQLTVLDGIRRSGEFIHESQGAPLDIPGLEDYMEYLVSSDSSLNAEKASHGFPVVTPQIDKVLANYRRRITVSDPATLASATEGSSSPETQQRMTQSTVEILNDMRIKNLERQISQLLQQVPTASTTVKAKRDIDHTSESESESCKENHRKGARRTKLPSHRQVTESSKQRSAKQLKNKKSERVGQFCKQKLKSSVKQPNSEDFSSNSPVESGELQIVGNTLRNASVQKSQHKLQDNEEPNRTEESTYRVLIQELDQERETRWKAEQTVKRLMDHMKTLQSQANEKKNFQDMAVHTSDRLKELLVKEKEAKSHLQAYVSELKKKVGALTEELRKMKCTEEDQRKVLKSLEETLLKTETQRLQQQTMEMKRLQEAELKASAAQKEVDLLHVSLRQQKEKVQQLQELLTCREQEHRKEVKSRVTLNGPEFQDAVSREVAKVEERHAQDLKGYQEKIDLSKQQYNSLEDEFRMALAIEANRFKEVKSGFDHVTAELANNNQLLAQSQQKEKQLGTLVQELTTMVKEQKAKIAELAKSKHEAILELKSRFRALEHTAEEDKRKTVQIELLKQEKSRLISQLTAQESVIDGLRAEKRIWGQELAQQGSSLAQDRGRLEARIEMLTSELESLKRQNEQDINALKIKTKILDDQTDTIRKLKEGLQERDEQIRKIREKNLQDQRNFQDQLENEVAISQDLKDKIEKLSDRKSELKQQLEEKKAELEERNNAFSAVNKKWQDKAEILTVLETQVKHMKESFDARERKLVEERDKALEAQKAAAEKLHSMDDAFRHQLEAVQVSHQTQLLQLANEKEKEIETAKQKVYQVEEEMRHLLRETAYGKKNMEEKIRKLTSALNDIKQEL
ncbi:leucine-rich repeat and coiled-coil domain-containing protein 1 isoform X1 [Hypanus sabinus]|uniref:leucine-rich repeat and coiled-coil domain-containing protein 1 isoform X1 n=1 Tax=Hypanus sabinus TaxID=79690 RepID=UPI0028C3B434|nr:leucine-rich repeat and coiled-coil domain-containing protein 1 isoform X1 [Hypanus sabinus]XP_059835214.1 leucine-rich repeat and coiled-coil domain-containing protein 1 isoform X1 [Hypanus sabinus]XP_059835222.1 leucine-rich repeat and coiled-coil domain-containing protein 1 isoform X1 [Hypanus sabinus]XP_059835231.1 leucine-rich repeat and coiled-coil domain-containing protein 1 isoform X1 [Hypanus sabinus]